MGSRPDCRNDRLAYFSPGCDVASANVVGVSRKATPGADEVGLSLPIRLVDAATFWTCSTRIARIHSYKRHSCKERLVGQKTSQLVERPVMQRAPLSPSYSYPVANAREILDGNSASGVFGLADDLFTDDVIGVRVEVLLPPSELPQVPPGTLGANALESGPELGNSTARRQRSFTRMRLPVRIDGEVSNTKIDTEPFFGSDGRPIRHLDGYEKKELALSVDQVGLTPYAFEPSPMVRADRAVDHYTTIQREQAQAIDPVLEAVQTLIVGDGPMLPEVDKLRLVSTVDFAHFRNGSNRMLRRKTEHVAEVSVVEFLQSDLVGTFQIKGPLSKPGACLVHARHRSKQPSLLVGIHEQLDSCDEFHQYRGSRHMEDVNYKTEQRFLPALKDGASALETR